MKLDKEPAANLRGIFLGEPIKCNDKIQTILCNLDLIL